MQRMIVLGSNVQCSDGKGGTLKGVVIDPNVGRLDYVIVHRGLLGGRDHCVPAGDISAAGREGMKLTISVAALKELPDVESRLPGQTYTQRSVPDHDVVIKKAIPMRGNDGKEYGTFHGVIVDRDFQIEGAIAQRENAPTFLVSKWDEDRLIVQPGAPLAAQAAGTTVFDPVCDREIDPATALKTEYHEKTYYFCSFTCRQAFETGPEQYIAKQRTTTA